MQTERGSAMKKTSILFAALTGCLLSLLGPSVLAAPLTTIRFGMEATYPPFESVDASGKIQGFDVDIANALCQQLKAQCTFSNQAFDSLIPSLKLGKFDALISALGVTAQRQQQVDFSAPYYQPTGSFVAPIAKHFTLADVPGKTIGVQRSSTFSDYLQHQYGTTITTKTYDSAQDAFLDLISGRVDMVLADTPVIQVWLKQNNNQQTAQIVDKPIVDTVYFGSGYAIAVDKNSALRGDLDNALTAIKKNGTYQKIFKKYFSN
jgi:arginine transport system substrate-binding protein